MDKLQYHRAILECMSEQVYVRDLDMNILYINPAAEDFTGWALKDVVGNKCYSVFGDEKSLCRWGCPVQKVISERVPIKHLEGVLKIRGGEARQMQASASPFQKEGKTVGAVVVMHDITERKQIEAEQRFLAQIIKQIHDALITADLNGVITSWNRGAERLFNYPAHDVIGMNLRALCPGEVQNMFQNEIIPTLLSKGLYEVDMPLQQRGGKAFYAALAFSLLKDNAEEPAGLIVYIVDITDKKRIAEALRESEERLARSKKMESLGRLAGGVAHDLNNVLSGIVSYPELLLMTLSEDSPLKKPLETIHAAGQRATNIVQDLLTVARGIATPKEPLCLNSVIEEYLLSPEFQTLKQLHPNVFVTIHLDNDLHNILGSPIHIRKVVANLFSNAIEAIEGRGDVAISTENRFTDRFQKRYDDTKGSEYVLLSVTDTGKGIAPEDLEKIFEPFYSKKVLARDDSGLGLAVVWNAVQDHDGFIEVASDEAKTIFELYFPISIEKIPVGTLPVSIKDFSGKGETVLVVDDMENQREIACRMLEAAGYKAKAVSSGEAAVDYLCDNMVDLILLDMIMAPGINGRETYERILKIHPEQKAIITSGFAETDEVKKAQQLGAGIFLKKPVTLEKLVSAVKNVLSS